MALLDYLCDRGLDLQDKELERDGKGSVGEGGVLGQDIT